MNLSAEKMDRTPRSENLYTLLSELKNEQSIIAHDIIRVMKGQASIKNEIQSLAVLVVELQRKQKKNEDEIKGLLCLIIVMMGVCISLILCL